MAFVKAVIQVKPASSGTGIKVSLKRTNKSAARMTFTVGEATAKQIGWADKDGIEILIGDGEHHGLIRFRKNKSAAQVDLERRETGKGAWYVLKLGEQPAFVDRSEAPRWCQWEKVEDGWIEIVLPKWADETDPRKAKRADGGAGIKMVHSAIAGTPAKQSVTAGLMGDPPPGRREMLAKMGDMKV